VCFGRDAQILRGLDALPGICRLGDANLFMILAPSGGPSSAAAYRDRARPAELAERSSR